MLSPYQNKTICAYFSCWDFKAITLNTNFYDCHLYTVIFLNFLSTISIINNSIRNFYSFKSPGNCGIPMPHSQLWKANILSRLHRARFSAQCPFSRLAFSSAWVGMHCQLENKIFRRVSAGQRLWCWKCYLCKKHYPVKSKIFKIWKEYQCSVFQRRKKNCFPLMQSYCFPKLALTS